MKLNNSIAGYISIIDHASEVVKHDTEVIKAHSVNHPDIADRLFSKTRYNIDRPIIIDIIWTSPECSFGLSKARGDRDTKTLAEYIPEYIKNHSRKDSYLYNNRLFMANTISKEQYNSNFFLIKNSIIQ